MMLEFLKMRNDFPNLEMSLFKGVSRFFPVAEGLLFSIIPRMLGNGQSH